MKKIISLLLALCMVLSLSAAFAVDASSIKVGFIVIGDENEGYSANHLNALNTACDALGISKDQVLIKYNVSETEAAYEACVDLAEQGCDIIFATSFGHESYAMLAAEEYPDVEFCHATGTAANSAGLANFHNYFTAVYEGRYVGGIVAGLKLNEMIANGEITAEEAKLGYVGAYPYAEIISGYTAFYLGARSVCPSVTMEVRYTNDWSNMAAEKTTAEALIANGCKLISQHADTVGAPTACEALGVPCVGYNIDMTAVAPTTALISPACNWAAYVQYALECVLNGEAIATDWCGGFAENAVLLTDLNTAIAPEGAQEAIDAAVAAIESGELQVFDCSTFTVNGETLTSAFALDTDGDWVNDTAECIVDGAFLESWVRSAPYFAYVIDGITAVTE